MGDADDRSDDQRRERRPRQRQRRQARRYSITCATTTGQLGAARDEIGIVRPLKHSQRGPTRVLPAFGAENFCFGRPNEALGLLIGQKPKIPQKGSGAVRIQN
jgi:hypothetical protein